MGLVVLTPPSAEPVTLAEARLQCRIDAGVTTFDDQLAACLAAAREHAEVMTGRALMTQTLKLVLDAFPEWWIELPRPPLQSVTSIVYLDTNGDSQTLDPDLYRVITSDSPGWIEPEYGCVWPRTWLVSGAVQITYVAGYTSAALVPAKTKQAIKMLVAHWFRNPESVVTGVGATELPQAVEMLLAGDWTGSYMGANGNG